MFVTLSATASDEPRRATVTAYSEPCHGIANQIAADRARRSASQFPTQQPSIERLTETSGGRARLFDARPSELGEFNALALY